MYQLIVIDTKPAALFVAGVSASPAATRQG